MIEDPRLIDDVPWKSIYSQPKQLAVGFRIKIATEIRQKL